MPIDLRNQVETKCRTSGFLPDERAWVQNFLDHGFVDIYRSCTLNVSSIPGGRIILVRANAASAGVSTISSFLGLLPV